MASELKAWIATWSTSPEAEDPDPKRPELNLEDQSLREQFRISVGEPEIRIRLSNEYGSSPLVIDNGQSQKQYRTKCKFHNFALIVLSKRCVGFLTFTS